MLPPEKNAADASDTELRQSFADALALHRQGQLAQAKTIYEGVLRLQPTHFDALHMLGVIAFQTGRYEEASELIARALAIAPGNADAHYSHGNVLSELKRHSAALASYDKALAINGAHAGAHMNRGNTLRELMQYQAALDSYEKVIALRPDYPNAYYARGNALSDLKRYPAALESYDRAIALKPDYPLAYYARGNALHLVKQYEAAVDSYDRVIALDPGYADAYLNIANALRSLGRHDAALASYDQAVALKGDYAFLSGLRLHTKMQICDWVGLEEQISRLSIQINSNRNVSPPLPVLAITSSPALQRKAAELWTSAQYRSSNNLLPPISKYLKHDKIRIGYFSSDFRLHPVSFLIAELFERHDKTKFEIFGFSSGPDSGDEMRSRLRLAFDHFFDVNCLSDQDVAEFARSLEIDIAVDLGGFTQNSRTAIFSVHAAPIQVSYLGYLGTMGAEFIDYLIADPVVIPEASRFHYSEKIAYLPSYQANDTRRSVSERVFTRRELGLPENGFVFCSFNNNYKITPSTFDGWMRILRSVEGSVLFLYAENDSAATNLRKEATARGIDADRLVFGARLPMPEYLARYRSADLFLDTLPYNAGATASDALWAGLPVLTCMGEAFASRIAASLLTAIDLPELIAATQEQFEALAVELATNSALLARIRRKLTDNRLTTPLFDIQRFAKHIEGAYAQMYARYQASLPPDHIYIRA